MHLPPWCPISRSQESGGLSAAEAEQTTKSSPSLDRSHMRRSQFFDVHPFYAPRSPGRRTATNLARVATSPSRRITPRSGTWDRDRGRSYRWGHRKRWQRCSKVSATCSKQAISTSCTRSSVRSSTQPTAPTVAGQLSARRASGRRICAIMFSSRSRTKVRSSLETPQCSTYVGKPQTPKRSSRPCLTICR